MVENRLPRLPQATPQNGSASTTQSPRSRRAPETKATSEWRAQGAYRDLSHRWTPGHGGPDDSVAEMPALEAKTVAELLLNWDTRDATLSALEEHATPIDLAVSLAAAPALVDLAALDTSEVRQEQWDRVCLLLGRLVAEADDDPARVLSAAFDGGRWMANVRWSEGNTVARALLKPAEELTLEDARSMANMEAYYSPMHVRGLSKPFSVLSGCGNPMEGLRLWMSENPLASKYDCLLRHLFSDTR